MQTDTRYDVCVVGAGVAGLTTAYMLAKEGKQVVVLDAAGIGGKNSMHTTAHLSFAMDDGLARLDAMWGTEAARRFVEAHRHAVDTIAAIVRDEGIRCGFERLPGYLSATPQDVGSLEDEAHAARRLGLPVGMVAEQAFGWGPSLRFEEQAQFHPVRYLDGLASALTRRGVRLCPDTRVTSVTERGRDVLVETESGAAVRCDHVVVATDSPIAGPSSPHTKMAPYRTYALAVRVEAPVEAALWWDRDDPYHYVRTFGHEDRSLLIVGGSDHRTGGGLPQQASEELEAWAREAVPGFVGVEARWSGQIMEPADAAGYIGGRGRTQIITGDSGHGWTHGTIGARLVTDAILGKADEGLLALFDPERFPRSVANLTRFKAAAMGHSARRAMPALHTQLPIAGEGRIVEHGWERVACYRDGEGDLHMMDPHCTHMGCLVSWNGFEKTWDCPCHGSRFSATGQPVQGPATQPLAPVDKTVARRVASPVRTMAEREQQETPRPNSIAEREQHEALSAQGQVKEARAGQGVARGRQGAARAGQGPQKRPGTDRDRH